MISVKRIKENSIKNYSVDGILIILSISKSLYFEIKVYDDTWFYVAFSMLVLGYTFHSVNIMLICFPLT